MRRCWFRATAHSNAKGKATEENDQAKYCQASDEVTMAKEVRLVAIPIAGAGARLAVGHTRIAGRVIEAREDDGRAVHRMRTQQGQVASLRQ